MIAALITVGASAQTKSETKYCCTKCDQCSSKPGKCSNHKSALVMEGKYYCPMHTDIVSDTAGNCSKCGMAMKKMEMETVSKYCCPKCDWTIAPVKGQCPHSTEAIIKDGELRCVYCHDNKGKCSKCGTTMEKVEIKRKKKS